MVVGHDSLHKRDRGRPWHGCSRRPPVSPAPKFAPWVSPRFPGPLRTTPPQKSTGGATRCIGALTRQSADRRSGDMAAETGSGDPKTVSKRSRVGRGPMQPTRAWGRSAVASVRSATTKWQPAVRQQKHTCRRRRAQPNVAPSSSVVFFARLSTQVADPLGFSFRALHGVCAACLDYAGGLGRGAPLARRKPWHTGGREPHKTRRPRQSHREPQGKHTSTASESSIRGYAERIQNRAQSDSISHSAPGRVGGERSSRRHACRTWHSICNDIADRSHGRLRRCRPVPRSLLFAHLVLKNMAFKGTRWTVSNVIPVAFVLCVIWTIWSVHTFLHAMPLLRGERGGAEYHSGVWQACIVQSSTFLLLVCLVRAIVTDPGSVPDAPEWRMRSSSQGALTTALAGDGRLLDDPSPPPEDRVGMFEELSSSLSCLHGGCRAWHRRGLLISVRTSDVSCGCVLSARPSANVCDLTFRKDERNMALAEFETRVMCLCERCGGLSGLAIVVPRWCFGSSWMTATWVQGPKSEPTSPDPKSSRSAPMLNREFCRRHEGKRISTRR